MLAELIDQTTAFELSQDRVLLMLGRDLHHEAAGPRQSSWSTCHGVLVAPSKPPAASRRGGGWFKLGGFLEASEQFVGGIDVIDQLREFLCQIFPAVETVPQRMSHTQAFDCSMEPFDVVEFRLVVRFNNFHSPLELFHSLLELFILLDLRVEYAS